MRIHWGWAAATVAALVATVLVVGSRSGSCGSPIPGALDEGGFVDTCQSLPIGGYPTMVVLAVVGLALTVVFARLAVRRR